MPIIGGKRRKHSKRSKRSKRSKNPGMMYGGKILVEEGQVAGGRRRRRPPAT